MPALLSASTDPACKLGLPKERESNCTGWRDSLYAVGLLTCGGQLGSVGRAAFSCCGGAVLSGETTAQRAA